MDRATGITVSDKPIRDVKVKKSIPGTAPKEKLFRVSNYNPVSEKLRGIEFDRLVTLHHSPSLHSPNISWVKAVAPAIVEKNRPVSIDRQTKVRVSHTGRMPDSDVVDEFHHSIVPAYVCEVTPETSPLTILDKIKCEPDAKVAFCHNYTADERLTIETLTRDQSDSVHWYKYRKGLITASSFYRVAGHVSVLSKSGKSAATENLVEIIVTGGNFKGNAATRYGRKQEPKALHAYEAKAKVEHTNAVISRSGLVISEQYTIGTSPDGLIKCNCHGTRLIEIKCPISLLSRNIESMDCLTKDEYDHFMLKNKGNTYYAQIQGQMGVTDIHCADLVVWDGKKGLVVPVAFDTEYWSILVGQLTEFHQKYVMLAVLAKFSRETCKPVLQERTQVQNKVSGMICRYPCGKCGQILKEEVANDTDASINCECTVCGCGQWFYWRCVHYRPDPDHFDEEPPWFCPRCVRNCDIVM